LGVAPLNAFGCNALFDSAAQLRRTGTTSYSDALSWVKGNHTLKFGGDYRDVRSAGYVDFNSRDALAFNRFPNQGQQAVTADAANQQIQDLAWMLVGGVSTQFQAQFFDRKAVRQPTDNKKF
jgi:hypothetical protein